MNINVNISGDEELKLMKRVKDEIHDELTEEAIENFIKNNRDINVLELIRLFNISNKYESLKEIPIKHLTKNEKFICMLYWMIYENLY